MSRIHQLDAGVINKIAAGEVIERPANVVKELLENSIDALSTRIDVDIAKGGSELIRIVDNGEGIHPDDILLTVASHATSKIQTADDLFEVQTMGFRGEALASIAEVSNFRVRSRQHDAVAGTELKVVCGKIHEPVACGCPVGTSIEVGQLFASTPVRRKFMKTVATEFGHISEHFTRIALAHPRLHMTLKHNQKFVHELPPTDRLIERIAKFFGNQLAEQLIWVESEANGTRMWGYVGHPALHKSTRKSQYIFLNGRWIQDRTLQHALTEAYRGLLMVGRQPVAFLFVDLPPELVDVNVHPTKVEVRFRDSQALYRQFLSMIRTRFLSMDLDSQLNVAKEPEAETTATPQPQQQSLSMELDHWASSATAPTSGPELSQAAEVGSASLMPSTASDVPINPSLATSGIPGVPMSLPTANAAEVQPASDIDAGTLAADNFASESGQTLGSEIHGAHEASQPHQKTVRALQVRDCYLVLETEEGLTVIDQHALHERILYEYFRPRVLSGSVESQRLLVPLSIDMGGKEAALLLDHAEVLGQIGFGIEEFGNHTVLLTRYPVMLAKADLTQLVRDIAEQLDSAEKKPTRRDIIDSLLHMMSCKAAIKAGQRLAPEEIDSLLAQRHLIDDAHHCPHGRPTALVLSQNDLDRQFGRLG
ncbi:MAG: DNA mismatch repair protein MutL [Planctomycetaceae bacterium]|nr:DNA mismatch repair protein MutL [Planctomycetaceae bacterium]